MSPDFSRDVHCLLGLPFDAVDMVGAELRLRAAIQRKDRCFLSTPNLNFAIAAQGDSAFRNSVVQSDLNVADGMPLVWIARLLGIPLPERVAGSTLFDRLRTAPNHGGESIKVYFFGGPDGVAERACQGLNAQPGVMVCVGFQSPGFGSVEEMSSDETIERINASQADFLIVSLGAKKGQAWIEHNLRRLRAPAISHLGAVVNFVAGTVKRSPDWMGRVGLEWAWRIWQEPKLWRRYVHDGAALARLLISHILPLWLHMRWRTPSASDLAAASLTVTQRGREVVLTLRGAWVGRDLALLRSSLADLASDPRPLQLDLTDLSHVDSAVVGLLSLLWVHRNDEGRAWRLGGIHPAVRRQLHLCCAAYLLRGDSLAADTSPREAAAC